MTKQVFNLGKGASVDGNITISGTPVDNDHAATVEFVNNIIKPPVVTVKGQGKRGTIPYILNDGESSFRYERNIKFWRVADTPEDVTYQETNFLTKAEMYDKWIRYSHDISGVQPAIPADLNAWVYDQTNDEMKIDTGTVSYVFLSSDTWYSDYTFEVSLNSSDTTGNYLGVVLSTSRDENGRQNTLSAVRSYISDKKWAIVYNLGMSDELVITEKNDAITLVGTGWNNLGTKIKVVRDNDQFTISTTQFGNNAYDPNCDIEFDLRDFPNFTYQLNKFIGEGSVGFMEQAQGNSSFKVLSFNHVEDFYINLTTAQVMVGNYEGVYTAIPGMYDEMVGPNRMLFCPRTKKLFYTKEYGYQIISDDNSFPVIPNATKVKHGLVMIGDNINVDNNGEISVQAPEMNVESLSGDTDLGDMVSHTYYRYMGSTNITINISTIASNVFSEWHIRQAGTGTITLVADTGVTLNLPFNGKNVTAGEGATIVIKRVALNNYDLFGQVEEL